MKTISNGSTPHCSTYSVKAKDQPFSASLISKHDYSSLSMTIKMRWKSNKPANPRTIRDVTPRGTTPSVTEISQATNVLLRLLRKHSPKKLGIKHYAPSKMSAVVDDNIIFVQLSNKSTVHPIIHVDRTALVCRQPTDIPNPQPAPRRSRAETSYKCRWRERHNYRCSLFLFNPKQSSSASTLINLIQIPGLTGI